ncbi:uncharacterized protein LOC121042537 isoform X2 [Herpailurus yagouaroundi]|uniref:uncharacterized protein LOC121042537 isoform X2 n=1 Tax=Herpailurus yagouaroundi TaxID=1608482 RepID=UPI001AD69E45|nr:uncharacterized protein LOC121042537 isoform X2 [Puma yagouaroundi]
MEGNLANHLEQTPSQGFSWPPRTSQSISVGRRLGDQGLTIEPTMGGKWMPVSHSPTKNPHGARRGFWPTFGNRPRARGPHGHPAHHRPSLISAPTEIAPGTPRGVWLSIRNRPRARDHHGHPAHHKPSLIPHPNQDPTCCMEESLAHLQEHTPSQGPSWTPCASQTLSVGRLLGDQGLAIETTMGGEWMPV